MVLFEASVRNSAVLLSGLGLASAAALTQHLERMPGASLGTGPADLLDDHRVRVRRGPIVSASSAIGFVVAGIGLILVAGVFIYGLCARPSPMEGYQDEELEELEEEAAAEEAEVSSPSRQVGPLLHM